MGIGSGVIKVEKSVKRFYWTVMLFLLIISAYPIGAGIRIIVLHFRNGSIQPDDYAQLVIPYAAVCSSILITIMLYPLLSKLRRYSVLAASILGLGLFAGMEWYMEGLTINAPMAYSAFQWQLIQNISITDAILAFHKLYDNTYRIHYLLISLLLILLVTGIVYTYEKVVSSKDQARRNILYLQIFLTVLFVALCVVSNITYIFGETDDYLTPYSSVFTRSFFVLAGLASGVYLAGLLIEKNRLVSIIAPAAAACLITAAMYFGEYKILDGVLYRFGYANLFQHTPVSVVTPANILIILLSGLLTVLLVEVICKYSKKADNAPANHQQVIQ
jgi:hypothetical protein